VFDEREVSFAYLRFKQRELTANSKNRFFTAPNKYYSSREAVIRRNIE
jgi:hypothetical protein